eukprot:2545312-Pyramimonas_sp.AAC.1
MHPPSESTKRPSASHMPPTPKWASWGKALEVPLVLPVPAAPSAAPEEPAASAPLVAVAARAPDELEAPVHEDGGV